MTVVGHVGALGGVALKTVLLFGTAMVLLRVSERRTFAQLSLFDIVVAVAIGAIIGRTATSRDTSWAEGAVALAVLLGAHRVLSLLRFLPGVRTLTDHTPRVLVEDGQVYRTQLVRSGITEGDLHTALRQNGISDMSDVKLVVLERVGHLTVVEKGESGPLIDRVAREGNGGGDAL